MLFLSVVYNGMTGMSNLTVLEDMARAECEAYVRLEGRGRVYFVTIFEDYI